MDCDPVEGGLVTPGDSCTPRVSVGMPLHKAADRVVVAYMLGSLQVNISHTRETLGWEPPVSVDEGLRRAVGPLRR